MAFRSAAVTQNPAGSPFNSTMPAGYQAHDRLVALWASDGYPTTITPPAGWTLAAAKMQFGTDTQTLAFYELRDAQGSGLDAVNWQTNASLALMLVIAAFSGRDNAAALDYATGTQDDAGGASPNTIQGPSGTASAGADLGWFASVDQTGMTEVWAFAPPGGYVERVDQGNSDFVSVGLATADNVAGGAQGTVSGTATLAAATSAGWAMYAFALKSSGAAPPSGGNNRYTRISPSWRLSPGGRVLCRDPGLTVFPPGLHSPANEGPRLRLPHRP